jgi:hypothetical protein
MVCSFGFDGASHPRFERAPSISTSLAELARCRYQGCLQAAEIEIEGDRNLANAGVTMLAGSV